MPDMTQASSDPLSADLISAVRVEGTPVYPSGEKLGAVEDIIIHKESGKVAYALLSFGGFLGLGEHCHPLPWDVLEYDTQRQGYVVNLDNEMLRNVPRCAPDQQQGLRDPALHREIYTYYGISPIW